jgi:hypothetical protein
MLESFSTAGPIVQALVATIGFLVGFTVMMALDNALA